MARRKKVEQPQFDAQKVAVLRNGKHRVQFDAWKVFSILNELRKWGADKNAAMNIAMWCAASKRCAGDRTELSDSGITVEIREVLKEV